MSTIYVCVSQSITRSLDTEKLDTCRRSEVGLGQVRSTQVRCLQQEYLGILLLRIT